MLLSTLFKLYNSYLYGDSIQLVVQISYFVGIFHNIQLHINTLFVSNWWKVGTLVEATINYMVQPFLLTKYDDYKWIEHFQNSKDNFWIYVIIWGQWFQGKIQNIRRHS